MGKIGLKQSIRGRLISKPMALSDGGACKTILLFFWIRLKLEVILGRNNRKWSKYKQTINTVLVLANLAFKLLNMPVTVPMSWLFSN